MRAAKSPLSIWIRTQNSAPKELSAERRADSVRMRRYLKYVARTVRSVFRTDPMEILTYYGYGNRRRAYVQGRVLEVRNVSTSTDSDSVFRNLLNTYRRAEADPIPFAKVCIEYAKVKI